MSLHITRKHLGIVACPGEPLSFLNFQVRRQRVGEICPKWLSWSVPSGHAVSQEAGIPASSTLELPGWTLWKEVRLLAGTPLLPMHRFRISPHAPWEIKIPAKQNSHSVLNKVLQAREWHKNTLKLICPNEPKMSPSHPQKARNILSFWS